MDFAQDSRLNINCYGSPETSRTQDELAGVQANLRDYVAQPIPDRIVSMVDTFHVRAKSLVSVCVENYAPREFRKSSIFAFFFDRTKIYPSIYFCH